METTVLHYCGGLGLFWVLVCLLVSALHSDASLDAYFGEACLFVFHVAVILNRVMALQCSEQLIEITKECIFVCEREGHLEAQRTISLLHMVYSNLQ